MNLISNWLFLGKNVQLQLNSNKKRVVKVLCSIMLNTVLSIDRSHTFTETCWNRVKLESFSYSKSSMLCCWIILQVSQSADHPSPQSSQCSRGSVRCCTGARAVASRLACSDCQVIPPEEHQRKYGCPTDRKDTVQLVQRREPAGETWSLELVTSEHVILRAWVELCFALPWFYHCGWLYRTHLAELPW